MIMKDKLQAQSGVSTCQIHLLSNCKTQILMFKAIFIFVFLKKRLIFLYYFDVLILNYFNIFFK